MTDADVFVYGSAEYENERKRRNHELFIAELQDRTVACSPDLRPTDVPFVMCGMCNSYPADWNASDWRCSKIQDIVKPRTEACERWTPRDDWKPDPPMYCTQSDRPGYDFGTPRHFEPLLPIDPTCESVSYVYFIQCGEYVKIGYSESPRDRIANIATSSPLPVAFIGLMVGTMQDERKLHKQFKDLRHRREWFVLTDDLKTEIRRLCGAERKWRTLLKTC